ncbi:hypothetical protein ZIOFF_016818 [Zingiber officinale]|uniref:Uncharacterized protein n=1 Tax=Zingiber officinale TaxID=94328 RepID=A0A8J5LNI2_ZINOF|nr:hypothetical protein ZIOFF_016818 [Zingiber officinale]
MATPPTLSLLQTPSSLKPLLSSINPSSSFSGLRSSARLQEKRIVDLRLVRRPSPPGPFAIRCTSGHGEYEYERGVYPRPQEIPWSKEFANSVHLIGTVGAPVQIKQLSSGKVVAWTRLGVKKSASETSWINLTFWDDLANVAFQHVEKGRQVYVSGRLVSDSVDGEDGKWQVIVQKLNFIERTFPAVSKYEQEMGAVPSGKVGNYVANTTASTVELWQAFFANPTEWWDNRNNKRNPKYPDFKHKDTGEVLWIESKNNPQWVKSQLAVLDSRMATLQANGSDASVSFMYGDDFTPFYNMAVGWNLGYCFPDLRRQLRCLMSEVMEERLATIIEALDLSLISTENSVTCAPCPALSLGTERSPSKDMEVSSCGASHPQLLIRWWNATLSSSSPFNALDM